jgi:hypothetical protein
MIERKNLISKTRSPLVTTMILKLGQTPHFEHLLGQGPAEQFPSIGCSIKWKAV